MTCFQESDPKIERFNAWLKATFVAAGLPARFAYWPGGYNSNLAKYDIRNAVIVAAACGERQAPHVFRDLVTAGSAVQIRLMNNLVKHNRPVLDCILHHCPAAPVRAVLERLDFFSKLSAIAPKEASSLKLKITHFRDLGPIALKAAKRNWGLFQLAVKISAKGHLDSIVQNWSGLGRLQNILVQEPRMIWAMGGVTAARLAERGSLCEMILPSFKAHLENNRRSGLVTVIPDAGIMHQMCDLVADGRVVVRLLGRLVEAYGLEGIGHYVKAPNPAWIAHADLYLELLGVVPENLVSTGMDLAATVSDPQELKKFVGLFKQLGGVAIPVIKALRTGHRFSSSELAAIWKARELGAEGAAYLDKLPVPEWGLAAKRLEIWREGTVDLEMIRRYRQAEWISDGGEVPLDVVAAARETLGIVRQGRFCGPTDVALQALNGNLQNFFCPPSDSSRDVLVVVATRTDYNLAIRELQSTFSWLSKNSHPVIIEGDTPEEIVGRIVEMRANHIRHGRHKLIGGIAFLGHGSPKSLEISARSTFSHCSREVFAEIGTHLAPGADCYLGGCLVAHRGDGQDSFADAVAKAMPHCVVRGCRTVRYSQPLYWDKELGFVEAANNFVEASNNHVMIKIGPYERARS